MEQNNFWKYFAKLEQHETERINRESFYLHFHFNVLSNCQLKFCSFICAIKTIFPSAIFGYLWRYWYFFHCSWHHFRFFCITQPVPFRLSTCGQLKLCSILQVARTIRSNYISELNLPTKCELIVRECLYLKKREYPLNMNSPINQYRKVNDYNMFVWWHMEW